MAAKRTDDVPPFGPLGLLGGRALRKEARVCSHALTLLTLSVVNREEERDRSGRGNQQQAGHGKIRRMEMWEGFVW